MFMAGQMALEYCVLIINKYLHNIFLKNFEAGLKNEVHNIQWWVRREIISVRSTNSVEYIGTKLSERRGPIRNLVAYEYDFPTTGIR